MEEYISVGNCAANAERTLAYSIDNTYERRGEHAFVFTIRVDDADDCEVGTTDDITVTIDFNRKTVCVSEG